MRGAEILALSLSIALSACAHRTLHVVSDPPGAFVYVFPHGKISTIAPGALVGLRASGNYTLVASLKGYETARVIAPAESSFPWPFPINFIIAWSGGYDETVTVKLYPCESSDGCGQTDPRLPGAIPR